MSPANRAEPDAAVVGPAGRAAGTPRFVGSGAGAASRRAGGESVSTRTPRVSTGWRPGGRPGVGTGCGGRRRRDSRPPDLARPVPAWLNFRDELPAMYGRAWSGSRVVVGSCPASATRELRSRETAPNLSFPFGKTGIRVSFAGDSVEMLRYGE